MLPSPASLRQGFRKALSQPGPVTSHPARQGPLGRAHCPGPSGRHACWSLGHGPSRVAFEGATARNPKPPHEPPSPGREAMPEHCLDAPSFDTPLPSPRLEARKWYGKGPGKGRGSWFGPAGEPIEGQFNKPMHPVPAPAPNPPSAGTGAPPVQRPHWDEHWPSCLGNWAASRVPSQRLLKAAAVALCYLAVWI